MAVPSPNKLWTSLVQNKWYLLVIVFLITFSIGILCHGFCYFNCVYSHDVLAALHFDDMSHKIRIGRFVQPLYHALRGSIPSPWLMGSLSLFWLSIANYLLIEFFNVKKWSFVFLLCGLTVSHYSLSLTNATYFHESDAFTLAFLLAILSCHVLAKRRWGFILATLLLCISIGLYQAYISTALVLLLIRLVQHATLKGSWKDFFRKLARYSLFVICSLSIYSMGLKVTQSFFDILPTDAYNSANNAMAGWTVLLIAKYAVLAYVNFFNHLFLSSPTHLPILNSIAQIGLIVISLMSIALYLYRSEVNRSLYVAWTIVLSLFPLCINIIFLLAKGEVHYLTHGAYPIFVIFCLYIININEQHAVTLFDKRLYLVGCLLATFMIISNFIYANQIYTFKNFVYQGDISKVTRIIAQIERVEAYNPSETPVILFGVSDFARATAKGRRPNFEHLKGTGISNRALTRETCLKNMIQVILGYPMRFLDEEEQMDVLERIDYTYIPIYPHPGFCQMIDGVMFIRMGDANE